MFDNIRQNTTYKTKKRLSVKLKLTHDQRLLWFNQGYRYRSGGKHNKKIKRPKNPKISKYHDHTRFFGIFYFIK
jgi:hypothetical protein